MKWLLGLDLRPLCLGAVRFAAWLARMSRAADGESFAAVHVVEEQHLMAVLRYHHLEEVLERARVSARGIVAAEAAAIGEPEIARAPSVEQGLEAARASHQSDAFLIGRAAGRAGSGVIRLGKVARRMLRSASVPVVVVPPDLRAGHLGDGPVVALTSLQPDSADACRFASKMAERLGRGLALVHVAPGPGEFPVQLPAATLDSLCREHREQAEEEIAAWNSAQRLRASVTEVLQGPIVESALEFAARQRSPLIVAGSRRLSTLERTLLHSTGADLAASAPVPVAVVPPLEQAQGAAD